jgi:hypothetical protein
VRQTSTCIVRAEHLAVVALLVAAPAALVVGILIFRRHLSLPTADGRVPLVGEDQELSREAPLRYQSLRAGGPVYQALSLSSGT